MEFWLIRTIFHMAAPNRHLYTKLILPSNSTWITVSIRKSQRMPKRNRSSWFQALALSRMSKCQVRCSQVTRSLSQWSILKLPTFWLRDKKKVQWICTHSRTIPVMFRKALTWWCWSKVAKTTRSKTKETCRVSPAWQRKRKTSLKDSIMIKFRFEKLI